MVSAPETMRIIRVFGLKSSEKQPEPMIAVKIKSLIIFLWADNTGKKRIMIKRHIKRIMLFLVSFSCIIVKNPSFEDLVLV